MKGRFTILFILVLISCKKNESPQNTDLSIISSIVNNVPFIIGNDTLVTKQIHNATLPFIYQQTNSFYIDVNNDQIFDFEIASIISGSPAIGGHNKAKITCLNSNSSVLCKKGLDTNFLSRTKTIDTNLPVKIYNSSILSCKKLNPLDSIITFQQHLIQLKANDTFAKTDNFLSKTFIMVDSKFSFPPSIYTKNDTTFYYFSSEDNSCNNFSNSEPVFIGFKIIDANIEKLGWIQIDMSLGTLKIIDSALQK